MKQKFKNYGVLIGERSTDYRANERVGALPYQERQLDGNWEPFLPLGEWQASDDGDSMSCVSFGEINGIETQEKQQTGIQVNYSDRWIAKMSATTREGNFLWKVAEAIRKHGLVLESDYPAPLKYTWDEYHADIAEPYLSHLKQKGQEWLKRWEVSYEGIEVSKASLMKHLKHGPLSVVLPGHLVLNFYTTQDVVNYFDSYPPYRKTTPSVVQAMKVLLTLRTLAPDPDSLFADLKFGDFGPTVAKLKRALIRLGWTEAKDLPDFYDQETADYVHRFFLANLDGWSWWWERYYYKGRLVDRVRRDVINNLLTIRT